MPPCRLCAFGRVVPDRNNIAVSVRLDPFVVMDIWHSHVIQYLLKRKTEGRHHSISLNSIKAVAVYTNEITASE